MPTPNENWRNNQIQFPRLLAEIQSLGLTPPNLLRTEYWRQKSARQRLIPESYCTENARNAAQTFRRTKWTSHAGIAARFLPATADLEGYPMAFQHWDYMQSYGGFRRWDIPAQCWSKAEYDEDTVRIFHDAETGKWWGDTEMNQCGARLLEPHEVEQAKAEFGIE